MNIKNLKRAAEIERQLPALEEARRILSDSRSFVSVHDADGTQIDLPSSMNYNIVAQLNVEINKMKEEVSKL